MNKNKDQIKKQEFEKYFDAYLNYAVFQAFCNVIEKKLKDTEKESKQKSTLSTKLNNKKELIKPNSKSVPDLSNLSVGQVFNGQWRWKYLYETVGWITKKKGRREREQEDARIMQFVDLIDDEIKKILTVNDIYETPIEKYDGRKHKRNIYAEDVEIILLNHLKRTKDGIMLTTRNHFWNDLNIISNYKKVPLEYYQKEIKEIPDNISYKCLNRYLKDFHNITDARLKEILNSALSNLESKAVINYAIYDEIVIRDEEGQKKYIPVIDDETGQLSKMILKAQQETLKEFKFPQIKNGKKIYIEPKDMRELGFANYNKFYEKYTEYIKKHYGWEYSFKRLRIVMTDNLKVVDDCIADAISRLNEKIKISIEKTIQTKYENKNKEYDEKFNENYNAYYSDILKKTKLEFEDILSENKINDVFSVKDYENEIQEIVNQKIKKKTNECVYFYFDDFPKICKEFAKYELNSDYTILSQIEYYFNQKTTEDKNKLIGYSNKYTNIDIMFD